MIDGDAMRRCGYLRLMKARIQLVIGVLALLAATPAAAALSPAEQVMVRTVDAEQARTLTMLEKWVNQNSGSLNLPGVAAVGEMLRAELEPLGFKVEWIDMKAAARAGHIVARHAGKRGAKRLLLIGHLDTVFEPDSPFHRWVREGDVARGPGAGDDKGGMAAMVAALRAMQAAGTLKPANITIVLTGDEEDAGSPISISRRDLIAEGKRADAALDFEGLAVVEGRDMGSIARRSASNWTVTVTGKSAHSSGVGRPGTGYGAIYELARIIDQFRRELPEDKLTFNVGLIGGGQSAILDAGKIRLTATGGPRRNGRARPGAARRRRHQLRRRGRRRAGRARAVELGRPHAQRDARAALSHQAGETRCDLDEPTGAGAPLIRCGTATAANLKFRSATVTKVRG
jgi:glutamate carboxypeptidase